ncbi:PIN domain-containing protein [Candidatus Woesearchaeota archaeon]|nr:PIN domain-containing protein [Candidatus Woesearchaeota archaeon]
MKLVVDSNIIIAALIKDSVTRKLLTHLDAELFTIKITEQEIKKYKEELCKKAGIDEQTFSLITEKIYDKMIILDDNLISTKIQEAKKIMDHIDAKDTPFIAAALAIKAAIWSDDKHFQKQNKVKIYKTNELISL